MKNTSICCQIDYWLSSIVYQYIGCPPRKCFCFFICKSYTWAASIVTQQSEFTRPKVCYFDDGSHYHRISRDVIASGHRRNFSAGHEYRGQARAKSFRSNIFFCSSRRPEVGITYTRDVRKNGHARKSAETTRIRNTNLKYIVRDVNGSFVAFNCCRETVSPR